MSGDLETILNLEHAVWQALVDGDAVADAALLAGDYLGVYETGYGDRAEHVAQLAHGPTVAECSIEKARLKPLADGVVLVAYLARFRRVEPQAAMEAMWVTSIWQRRIDGVWENVFSQDTAQGATRPV